MTPAQRKYDQDLIASLRQLSLRIAPRSRKVGDALRMAAQRLDALSSAAPVEAAPHLDQHGQPTQPASSKPDQAHA